MSRLPKQFLCNKPARGTIVIVCSDPKHHYKGVVTNSLPESPDYVEVTSLRNKSVVAVAFRELTKGKF